MTPVPWPRDSGWSTASWARPATKLGSRCASASWAASSMREVVGGTVEHGAPARGALFWQPYRSDVSLALLAGGLSSRMGEDKAFALFQGGTLLEWMRDRIAPLFPHVFVVTREPSRFHGLGLPVVNDALTEGGSAVGVY